MNPKKVEDKQANRHLENPYLGVHLSDQAPAAMATSSKTLPGGEIQKNLATPEDVDIQKKPATPEVMAEASPPSSSPPGVIVTDVVSESPADRAGVKESDVIRQIGETSTPNLLTFSKALNNYQPGDYVRLTLYRKPSTINPTTADEQSDLIAVRIMLEE